MNKILRRTIAAITVGAVLTGVTSSVYADSGENGGITAEGCDGTIYSLVKQTVEIEDPYIMPDQSSMVNVRAEGLDGTVYSLVKQTVEIENNSVSPRSAIKPAFTYDNFYDLTSSNYRANLVEVAPSMWLYTNKYFIPNSSGQLYVKYSVKKLSGIDDVNMRIGIFDLTANTCYTGFITNKVTSYSSYTTGQVRFKGLNPDHYYAVGFLSELSPIGEVTLLTGSAVIGHSLIS